MKKSSEGKRYLLQLSTDPTDGLKPFPWKKLPPCPVQLPCSTPGSVDSVYQNTSHPIVDQYSHPTSGHR